MNEHPDSLCRQRVRSARRLAWRAGFEEAMRTVEVNVALLLLLAEQQAECVAPDTPEYDRACQRVSDLTQVFAVITSNPVDRMDDRARLSGALAGAVEQILAPLRQRDRGRNMEGAEDLIHAVLMGLPLWPNAWGQDVATAAWVLTDGGTRTRFSARAPGTLLAHGVPDGMPMREPRPTDRAA